MSISIENISMVFGSELELVKNGRIEIRDGSIVSAGEGNPTRSSQPAGAVLNGEGLLAIPGLIDAHVHLADSVLKDLGVGANLDLLVHPVHGLKMRLLDEARQTQLLEAMVATVSNMLTSGITTFADFREGGLEGVQLEQKALHGIKSRALILGRPNYHFNQMEVSDESRPLTSTTMQELLDTIETCNGLGISGANEYTTAAMEQISDLARENGKLLGVHASESAESQRFSKQEFSSSEVERVLRHLRPDFLVHLTHASQEDIKLVSKNSKPVVCCPRANAILGLGVPPLLELLEAGVTVALGTDNVMLAAPDMFREMDFASRILRASTHDASAISSKDVLRMATVGAAKALGLDSEVGSIEEGKRADLVFLDLNSANLRFSQDPVASVVHRAGPDDIRCVMVDGEIVHGSIPSC
jgi:cytosine/adenosine deaminase-related metal-dependent hydrolase